MFPSRDHQRRRRSTAAQRARQGRGLLRRLGVETMEGRLMLSGTTIEYTPMDLEAAQISLSALQSNPDYSQYVIVATLWEGGFVADHFTLFGSDADSDVAGAAGLFGNKSETLESLINRGTQATVNSDEGSGNWLLFDATGVLNDGTIVQVIALPPSLNAAAAELEPVLDGYVANQSTDDEGGLIPIQPILAEPSGGARSGESLAQALRRVSPVKTNEAESFTALAATATATSSDSAISGEWARAMVFEMAGGEPEQADRPDASDDGELRPASTGTAKPATGQPLSAMEANRAAIERGANENGGGTAAAERTPLHVNELGDLSDNVFTGLDVLPANWSGAGDGAATDADRAASLAKANVADGAAGVFAAPDLAVAAAFEDFGGGESTVIPSFSHDILRGSLGATPLLMVLALERIAASNSRRAKKDAVGVGTRAAR